MQCHDDGSLFHIGILPNGYHRTSTSSTTHSFEVCKSFKEIYRYVTFRLSWAALHIRSKLISASALDSTLYSLKVKVKAKVRLQQFYALSVNSDCHRCSICIFTIIKIHIYTRIHSSRQIKYVFIKRN